MTKGARAKAKANAAQGIREMVEIAADMHYWSDMIAKGCKINVF